MSKLAVPNPDPSQTANLLPTLFDCLNRFPAPYPPKPPDPHSANKPQLTTPILPPLLVASSGSPLPQSFAEVLQLSFGSEAQEPNIPSAREGDRVTFSISKAKSPKPWWRFPPPLSPSLFWVDSLAIVHPYNGWKDPSNKHGDSPCSAWSP